jgi:hypothetical protein
MMRGLIRVAGGAVLVGAIAGLCGAGAASASPAEPGGSTPTANSVSHQRYVVPVELDRGALRVVPAPKNSRPTMSLAAARELMRANTSTISYRSVVLGYGVVTIATHASGVPHVTSLAAWVGFSKEFAAINCPMMRVQTGTSTTALPSLPSAGYAAFVVGAAHGSPAVTYVATAAPCGNVARASLSNASEEISIPWQALGPIQNGSLSVRTTIPPCGIFASTSSGGSAQSTTITVTAVVPDVHGHCHGPQSVTESVFISPEGDPGAPPPIVTAQTRLLHGPLGPQDHESGG